MLTSTESGKARVINQPTISTAPRNHDDPKRGLQKHVKVPAVVVKPWCETLKTHHFSSPKRWEKTTDLFGAYCWWFTIHLIGSSHPPKRGITWVPTCSNQIAHSCPATIHSSPETFVECGGSDYVWNMCIHLWLGAGDCTTAQAIHASVLWRQSTCKCPVFAEIAHQQPDQG